MSIRFQPGDHPSAYGHHFLIGLQPSPGLTDHDRRLLAELRPAGVILFRDDFDHESPYPEWMATLGELLREVREIIGRRRILVAMDHEGGRVHRPPNPITHWPPAVAWQERAAEYARAMAEELRSLGINLNFAPVADVAASDTNSVVGDRAFGSRAEEVSAAVASVVTAFQEEGVWACVKHFPGHGATTVDSHYDLPSIDIGLDELRATHLPSFAAAVEAGARCLMSAHLSFPRIDPEWPVTMSRVFLHRLLREQMGYGGLLTTDDLGMHAVSRRFDQGAAVAATLGATTDLLMICAHWTDTRRALSLAGDIHTAVKGGKLAETTLFQSFERVRRALEEAPQHRPEPLDESVLRRHHALAGSTGPTATDPTRQRA